MQIYILQCVFLLTRAYFFYIYVWFSVIIIFRLTINRCFYAILKVHALFAIIQIVHVVLHLSFAFLQIIDVKLHFYLFERRIVRVVLQSLFVMPGIIVVKLHLSKSGGYNVNVRVRFGIVCFAREPKGGLHVLIESRYANITVFFDIYTVRINIFNRAIVNSILLFNFVTQ